MKKQFNGFAILILGLLLLAAELFNDYLFEKLWIFYLLPIVLLGLAFLILFIFAIIKRRRKSIFIGIIMIGSIFIFELSNSEIFKGKKVIEATLMDDLSAIHLTLRDNNNFEVNASTMFTEQIFKGTYRLQNNKIIFNDKHYDNDFIPDTLTIIEDKIILKFDSNGIPNTDFANYFDIKKNRLNSTP